MHACMRAGACGGQGRSIARSIMRICDEVAGARVQRRGRGGLRCMHACVQRHERLAACLPLPRLTPTHTQLPSPTHTRARVHTHTLAAAPQSTPPEDRCSSHLAPALPHVCCLPPPCHPGMRSRLYCGLPCILLQLLASVRRAVAAAFPEYGGRLQVGGWVGGQGGGRVGECAGGRGACKASACRPTPPTALCLGACRPALGQHTTVNRHHPASQPIVGCQPTTQQAIPPGWWHAGRRQLGRLRRATARAACRSHCADVNNMRCVAPSPRPATRARAPASGSRLAPQRCRDARTQRDARTLAGGGVRQLHVRAGHAHLGH